MSVYLAVMTVVALFALASLLSSKRLNTVLCIVPLILLEIFMGFRYRIGGDWDMYTHFFAEYQSMPFAQAHAYNHTEYGYAALNTMVVLFHGNFTCVLLVCSFILLAGIYYFAIEFEVDPSLTLFLACPYMLFVAGMGYNRQATAIGFTLIALAHLHRNRLNWFYLFAVLAFFFHYSSIIYLIFVWANTKKRVLIGVIATLLILFTGDPSYVTDKYSAYSTGVVAASGVWLRLFIVGSGIAFAFIQRDKWGAEVDPSTWNTIKRTGIIFLVLVAFASFAASLVDRFNLYLFPIALLCMARSIEFSQRDHKWITTMTLFVESYGVFFLWFTISTYAREAWLPYHFAFQ